MRIEPVQAKNGKYLKANSAGYAWIILSVMIAAAGFLCWFFFGSHNDTIRGTADVGDGRNAFCIVAAEDIDKVKEGMSVTIENARGKVLYIEPGYNTYEMLRSAYGPVIQKMGLEEDKSYYFVAVDITTLPAGYKPYTIVVKTVTPFERYLGGKG